MPRLLFLNVILMLHKVFGLVGADIVEGVFMSEGPKSRGLERVEEQSIEFQDICSLHCISSVQVRRAFESKTSCLVSSGCWQTSLTMTEFWRFGLKVTGLRDQAELTMLFKMHGGWRRAIAFGSSMVPRHASVAVW